jgi:hypothetical protein
MSKDFRDLKRKISIDRTNDIPEYSSELPYLKRKVTYRAMKNKELKSFLKAMERRDEYAINKALDDILESCVATVDNDPYDNDSIYTQDRIFLLVKVRQATLGDVAKFPHVFAEDKDPVEVQVDLNEFPVIYKDEPIEQIVELTSGVRVVLGAVTRGTEKQMEDWLKRNASKDSMVDRRYSAYAALIQKVEMLDDNKEDWDEVTLTYADKVKFVEEYCSPGDIEKFDTISDKLDFGIKLVFNFKHEDYENESEEINILSFFIT